MKKSFSILLVSLCLLFTKASTAQVLVPFAFWKPQTPASFVALEISASANYTVPAGCNNLVVKIWGGGGGAGGGSQGYVGLNGGAGDYRTGTLTVATGDVLNIYIGSGGGGGLCTDTGASCTSGVRPTPGGASGTTTGVGNGGVGGNFINTSGGGGGGGGGGAASSIVRSGTTLVLSSGAGGGSGGNASSNANPLNVGGSGSGGLGSNDVKTQANCMATFAVAASSCYGDRITSATNNGAAGAYGGTGGGGGGGGGGIAGGTSGHGGSWYGNPYRGGGGDAGTSTGLSSGSNTTYGGKGTAAADGWGFGGSGASGHVSLVSCT